jgi:hypothetical protein
MDFEKKQKNVEQKTKNIGQKKKNEKLISSLPK